MDFESIVIAAVTSSLKLNSLRDHDDPIDPVGDLSWSFPGSSISNNPDINGGDEWGQACLYNTETCTKQEPIRDSKNHDVSLYI